MYVTFNYLILECFIFRISTLYYYYVEVSSVLFQPEAGTQNMFFLTVKKSSKRTYLMLINVIALYVLNERHGSHGLFHQRCTRKMLMWWENALWNHPVDIALWSAPSLQQQWCISAMIALHTFHLYPLSSSKVESAWRVLLHVLHSRVYSNHSKTLVNEKFSQLNALGTSVLQYC